MGISDIISLLSGVALFLFGMALMGEGLRKTAGGSLEMILYKLSNTAWKSVLLGTGVTAVIQSSSATSVMVVGFVNSGMMKFRQAIGIILGAILGTSVTGWILCLSDVGSGGGWTQLLSTATITGIAAIVGIILRMVYSKSKKSYVGDLLMGFAVLMFGMSTMSGAVSPLKESPQFIGLLTNFSNPILGILVGAMIACILQSASAAVGILQALAFTGAVTFEVAFPIIMGIAIGASFPVLLSSIGASTDGKRAAFIYLLIDVLGALFCAILFYSVNAIHPFDFMQNPMNMFGIAALNSIFRAAVVLILFPLIPVMERIVCLCIKSNPKSKKNAPPDGLDDRFLTHPALAIMQCGLVIANVAQGAMDSILMALGLLDNFSEKEMEKVSKLEQDIDHYEDRMGTYLMKVTAQTLTLSQNKEVSRYLHTLSDFERISDHAMNIAKTAEEIHTKKIVFSEEAVEEFHAVRRAVNDVVTLSITSYANNDLKEAEKVEPLVKWIGSMCDTMKLHHIDRLQSGLCTFEHGFVFNDLLTNYERVAAHCSNIAIAIIALEADTLDTHESATDLKEQNGSFMQNYREYQKLYHL